MGGRSCSTTDDCTEIFYRLNIIFPPGLLSPRRTRHCFFLHMLIPRSPRFSSPFALFNRAPCPRSDESSTRCPSLPFPPKDSSYLRLSFVAALPSINRKRGFDLPRFFVPSSHPSYPTPFFRAFSLSRSGFQRKEEK